MAVIVVKGAFDPPIQNLPTFKQVACFLKNGEKVLVDFNLLEMDYHGNIKVSVEGNFIKPVLLTPSKKSSKYFEQATVKLKMLSLERKKFVKRQEKLPYA
jgi:hypothetical protein